MEGASPLLTIREVCGRLRISRMTATKYLYQGSLPGATRMPGGGWRIPETALDDLLTPRHREREGGARRAAREDG